jgi:hypothetical protein
MKNYFFLLLSICFACDSTNKNSQATGGLLDGKPVEMVGPYHFSTDSLISRLPSMKADTLRNMLQNCDANIYWKIVKRGQASIPLLIESLTDTTLTNIYSPCKKGNLNVGELSQYALEEIAEFPAFVVTHIQFCVIDENGCWSFYDYLYDNRNKPAYKTHVQKFYRENKYVWRKFKPEEMNECRRKYGITGKYYLAD